MDGIINWPMVGDILHMLFLSVLVILAGIFAYVTSHIIEERKQKKHIPLPWERKK